MVEHMQDDKKPHKVEYTIENTGAEQAIKIVIDGKECKPQAVIVLSSFDYDGVQGMSLVAGGESRESMIALVATALYKSPELASTVIQAIGRIEETLREQHAQRPAEGNPVRPETTGTFPTAQGPQATAANRPGFYI